MNTTIEQGESRQACSTVSGSGSCNGSFGELLQGVLEGQRKFLVNLKIRNASRVSLELLTPEYSPAKEARYAESYQKYPKTHKMLRNILSDLGRHEDCVLTIDSDIPVGKGLSSSTADMVACTYALADAMSIAVKSEYISRILTEIEPNDGLHYQGTSAYCHTSGELLLNVDFVPAYTILGIDLGGSVDTVRFNARTTAWSEEQTNRYAQLLEEVKDALEQHDARRLAAIATESAVLWQEVLAKPQLETVLNLAERTDAWGVVNTHSGTYLGLLYPPMEIDRESLEQTVQGALDGCSLQWFETLGVEQEALTAHG